MNSLMESMWKNRGANLRWKLDAVVPTCIGIMTMCKSPSSKPYLDFDFILKISTLAYMPFCKRWWCHSIWGDFNLRVILIKSFDVYQITMKIIITWIFHGLICNMIKLKVESWMHFFLLCLKGFVSCIE